MPDKPSITTIKTFRYRDTDEEFSNTYHFSGTEPSSAGAWKTLADALVEAEAAIYSNLVKLVRVYGYQAGTEHSVYQYDLTVAPAAPVVGYLTGMAGSRSPGDAAATTRWWTGELNSRGKKIYCRKYWHSVYLKTADSDELDDTQRSAMDAFGAKLIDGTLPGSFKYCGPQGATLGPPQTSVYVTTRTLKRRGRRPLASG